MMREVTEAWVDGTSGSKPVAGAALLSKACDLLDLVGRNPGLITASSMSARTGIPRATLYRILAALTARGLIRIDPLSQNLTLGFGLLELSQSVWSSGDLTAVAAGHLRRLRDLTGETAYLAVREGWQVLSLQRFVSAHPNRSHSALGVQKPMHCTSQGKALLAHLPPSQLDAFMKQTRQRFTPKTLVEEAQLRSDLSCVRTRGFAIDDEEIVPGIRCVGAAILDDAGRAIAAISVAAPIYRMGPERAEQLGMEIVDTARRISAELPPQRIEQEHSGDFQVLTDAPAFDGASPVWVDGRLIWADRLAPAIYGLSSKSVIGSETLTDQIQAFCPVANSALVVTNGMLKNLDATGKFTTVCPTAIIQFATRSDGSIWAAEWNEASETSRIGVLAGNGTFEPHFEFAGRVGGLAFANLDKLVVSVPSRSMIYACDLVHDRRRVLANIPRAAGMPSGLACDARGGLWIAMYDGWSVLKIDQLGEIERTIALPFPRPTGITFGGVDGTQLIITSQRMGVSKETLLSAPLSGHCIAVEIEKGSSPNSSLMKLR